MTVDHEDRDAWFDAACVGTLTLTLYGVFFGVIWCVLRYANALPVPAIAVFATAACGYAFWLLLRITRQERRRRQLEREWSSGVQPVAIVDPIHVQRVPSHVVGIANQSVRDGEVVSVHRVSDVSIAMANAALAERRFVAEQVFPVHHASPAPRQTAFTSVEEYADVTQRVAETRAIETAVEAALDVIQSSAMPDPAPDTSAPSFESTPDPTSGFSGGGGGSDW